LLSHLGDLPLCQEDLFDQERSRGQQEGRRIETIHQRKNLIYRLEAEQPGQEGDLSPLRLGPGRGTFIPSRDSGEAAVTRGPGTSSTRVGPGSAPA
jgi:hypothetical protein